MTTACTPFYGVIFESFACSSTYFQYFYSYLSKYVLSPPQQTLSEVTIAKSVKSASALTRGNFETPLTDILCIDFGFWVVISVSGLFFSSAKQDTMTHKTPLITASGHKDRDLRHPLIMASRRMVLDWLSFSSEAECMDRLRRYVKLYGKWHCY